MSQEKLYQYSNFRNSVRDLYLSHHTHVHEASQMSETNGVTVKMEMPSGEGEEARVQEQTNTEESIKSQGQVSADSALNEDDLEEGELKDDDDDDDDDDDVYGRNDKESKKSEGSTSKSPSSSSSSPPPSPSSESKEPSSSRSSSRGGSNIDSSKSRSSSRINSDDRFKFGRDRGRDRDKDKLDPNEKAAKLISMRTALLEARSREIEMKFNKNKTKLTGIPKTQQPLTLLKTPPPTAENLKMTITKPSISYAENPNPPKYTPPEVEREQSESTRRSSKSAKREAKEKKSKKTPKKSKKKSSPKKHKKHKSSNSARKSESVDARSSPKDPEPLPYVETENQGPRTPPDNHVTTIDDEQIEWPSHLIRMTITQPSISYSVNPDSVMDPDRIGPPSHKRRKSSASISQLSSPKPGSPCHYRHRKSSRLDRKYSSTSKPAAYGTDLNSDYEWCYNYFINSFDMSPVQAQQQAFVTMIAVNSYEKPALEKWLNTRGFTILSHEDEENPDSQDNINQTLSENTDAISSDDKLDLKSSQSTISTIVTRIARNQVNRDIDEAMDYRPDADVPESNETPSLNSDSTMEVEAKIEPKSDLVANVEIKKEDDESQLEQKPDCGKQEEEALIEKKPTDEPEAKIIPTISPNKSIVLRPIKPKITVLKSRREIVLPNGQVLPPGTIQKIVHPYPRLDSEVLHSCFDMH